MLTKSDAADTEMVELAGLEVRELVAGSFLDHAPMLAVSSKTGEGLDALRDVLASVGSELKMRRVDGAARLPVDRVFGEGLRHSGHRHARIWPDPGRMTN